jgi:hypothetical protein
LAGRWNSAPEGSCANTTVRDLGLAEQGRTCLWTWTSSSIRNAKLTWLGLVDSREGVDEPAELGVGVRPGR